MQEPLEEGAGGNMSVAPPGLLEPVRATPSLISETGAGLQLTSAKLRAWGMKSALALLDQGLFSGAGFLVNLLLARWLAPDSYGAFAVAFAGFLFIYGFHNVLLLEPMSVLGPSRYSSNLPAYFRAQLLIHFLLVGWLVAAGLLGGVAILRVTPDSPLVGAIFGSALMLPLLLLLWLVRRMCYALQSPRLAVAGTASYLVLIVAGLLTLHRLDRATPFLTFLLMGGASLVASGVLLARIGLFRGPQWQGGITWRVILRENWTYGRWLVGGTVLSSIVSQAQVFFVSALLGLGAAGVLRAMQLPALMVTQVSTATGFLILPVFAYDVGAGTMQRMREKAILVSLGISTFALILGALTWAFAGPLERALFSGKYASYAWLMPALVLVTVAYGPMQGCGMALRAIRKPQFDLASGVFAAPIAILCAYFGTMWWGFSGAVLSLLLGFAIQAGGTSFYFHCFVRNQEVPDELAALPVDSKKDA